MSSTRRAKTPACLAPACLAPASPPPGARRSLACAVFLLGALGGCAPSRSLAPHAVVESGSVRGAAERLTANLDNERRAAQVGGRESRALTASQAQGVAAAPPTPAPFDLDHPRVEPFVRHYAERDPKVIAHSLRRAAPHMRMVRDTLARAGVPAQLAYLPIVESKFKVSARSRAGAAGMWQFMPPTGRHYGLVIDRCVDERNDPVRSTRAAARYLAELHDHFADWHLALAAYNAGEGRIARIMRKHGVDDYWSMVDRGLLPRETANFVPRLLAVATIADNPEAFGVVPAEAWPDGEATVTVTVEAPISLKSVAILAGLDRAVVEELNPALRCKRVPRGGYDVRLPRASQPTFSAAYAALDPQTILYGDGIHHVRRGESPASIARLYGVSVRDLMTENGIRNPRRLRVDARLRIPDPM